MVGEQVIADSHQNFEVPFYDAMPVTNILDVEDIGGGMVRVTAQGRFIAEGLRVRIGGAILDQN